MKNIKILFNLPSGVGCFFGLENITISFNDLSVSIIKTVIKRSFIGVLLHSIEITQSTVISNNFSANRISRDLN